MGEGTVAGRVNGAKLSMGLYSDAASAARASCGPPCVPTGVHSLGAEQANHSNLAATSTAHSLRDVLRRGAILDPLPYASTTLSPCFFCLIMSPEYNRTAQTIVLGAGHGQRQLCGE